MQIKIYIKFIVMVLLSTSLTANELIDAKDMRKVSKAATDKLIMKVINSENGKKAYNGLISYFNKKLSKIAAEGYYDTHTITYLNQAEIISTLLKPLSKKEQSIIRDLVIKELEVKGYKITKNQFWNNENSFNISVSF